MDAAGDLVRDARRRHGLSQASLARRARTTQKQISRIERGETSPSVATLARLLATMGERLELRAVPGPRDNRSDAELRADFCELSATERIAQTSALSRALTGIRATDASHEPRRAGEIEPTLGLLSEHDVEFVIIGGFALAAHGVVRGTNDIDIVPSPDPRNLTRLVSALRALDAEVMWPRIRPTSSVGARRARLGDGRQLGASNSPGRHDVMQDVPGIKSYRHLSDSAALTHVAGAGNFPFAGLDDSSP